jgi:hypothetical protein
MKVAIVYSSTFDARIRHGGSIAQEVNRKPCAKLADAIQTIEVTEFILK